MTYPIDFIKWILESNTTKHQLEKYLIGTSVKTIPVVKLRKLPIPNIDPEQQQQLSYIINNWNKQKYLYKQLIKEKENYYNIIINKIIKGEG